MLQQLLYVLTVCFDQWNHSRKKCVYKKSTLNSPVTFVKLLKPTGYVTYQQFNFQQLYALPTLYLCVLYLSANKQRLVPLTS